MLSLPPRLHPPILPNHCVRSVMGGDGGKQPRNAAPFYSSAHLLPVLASTTRTRDLLGLLLTALALPPTPLPSVPPPLRMGTQRHGNGNDNQRSPPLLPVSATPLAVQEAI